MYKNECCQVKARNMNNSLPILWVNASGDFIVHISALTYLFFFLFPEKKVIAYQFCYILFEIERARNAYMHMIFSTHLPVQ